MTVLGLRYSNDCAILAQCDLALSVEGRMSAVPPPDDDECLPLCDANRGAEGVLLSSCRRVAHSVTPLSPYVPVLPMATVLTPPVHRRLRSRSHEITSGSLRRFVMTGVVASISVSRVNRDFSLELRAGSANLDSGISGVSA
jgi:hypothetical protein